MARFLIVILLLVCIGVGLGFYLGYFTIGTEKVGDATNITLTVDQKKIKEDEKKAADKLHELEKGGKGTSPSQTPPTDSK